MKRFACLLSVLIALCLFAAPSFAAEAAAAEETTVVETTAPAEETQTEEAMPVVEAGTCSEFAGTADFTFPVTPTQVLLPTDTSLRICEPEEEAQCGPACVCFVVRNEVNCFYC